MDFILGILLAIGVGVVVALVYPELGWPLFKPLELLARWVQHVVLGINKPTIGAETLVGKSAKVIGTSVPSENGASYEGQVSIDGETWSVRSSEPFDAGQSVKIKAARGAILDVAVT